MSNLKEYIRAFFKKIKFVSVHFFQYIIFAIVIGILVGLVGSAFYHCMHYATVLRETYSWILYLLPLGGLLIVGDNYLFKDKTPQGTNIILKSIRNKEHIPLKVAPTIFIDTVLTHLFGGSAGREGAALQLGGSIGSFIGNCFHSTKLNRRILTLCGMSAAFSALFGTPLAASIFALEVVNVGAIYYSALVPCVLSSVIAHLVAKSLNVAPELFNVSGIPELNAVSIIKVIVLALLAGIISIIFCKILHLVKHALTKHLPNPFIRIFVGGLLIILLTLILNSRDYLGAGMNIIERCITENSAPETSAFLLKIVFTAITLGAGFCGGEIVPSFFIGATFGAIIGPLLGLEVSFSAAIGMLCVFCGVTNCPISTLIIGFELFGFTGVALFFIAICISYLLSGNESLYSTQAIVNPKFGIEYGSQDNEDGL
ncbi:MAG: chloride channel protein [Lachnospiraceae bacterium]|nr:chloride channel protein [Lachnospiraceae bacterium]